MLLSSPTPQQRARSTAKSPREREPIALFTLREGSGRSPGSIPKNPREVPQRPTQRPLPQALQAPPAKQVPSGHLHTPVEVPPHPNLHRECAEAPGNASRTLVAKQAKAPHTQMSIPSKPSGKMKDKTQQHARKKNTRNAMIPNGVTHTQEQAKSSKQTSLMVQSGPPGARLPSDAIQHTARTPQ